jgi:nucleoside-diphosphate kinase
MPPSTVEAFDRSQPTREKMNRVGMPTSEIVQLDEIVVILGMQPVAGAPTRGEKPHFAGSLAVTRARRYKPATPISGFQGQIMAIERTFSIIKPDATERNLTGAINALIEKAGLRIVAQKRIRMTREQAQTFYAVHKARPFFGELVDFMISAPVVVQVLEGENAVLRHRDVMGATDPSKAADGTIRKLHAKSIGENSVHGSDAPETAAVEIAQFFSGNEIVG